jgi:bacteriorhodopsin
VLLQVFVITLLLMMVLLVSAVLALPTWPYAEKWGYYPTGACGAIVTTMAALILAGRL